METFTKLIADIRLTIKKLDNGYLVEWNLGVHEHGQEFFPLLDQARNKAYQLVNKFEEIQFFGG